LIKVEVCGVCWIDLHVTEGVRASPGDPPDHFVARNDQLPVRGQLQTHGRMGLDSPGHSLSLTRI